jgi:hypothetical protein
MEWGERAQLALDTVYQKQTRGIPSCGLFLMDHEHIERIAGVQPGEYVERPEEVYLAMQQAAGACVIDQFIPLNPLTMAGHGYENTEHGATTGAAQIVCDGVVIDSPETVVEHMERFVFPSLASEIADYDESTTIQWMTQDRDIVQSVLGPNILKTGYGGINFPGFYYGAYGYENYFMAYALYPEVLEKHFSLQADLALMQNKAAAKVYATHDFPPLHRLDYDIADSRGTLVDVKSLDRIWFPHFARCLEPLLRTDLKMIWHCDGNLMEMVPRLLDVGLVGFQGFQYECGMDYEKICAMKTRDGEDLIIMGGVSVTTTLPHGTPADVKAELDWLVDKGPRTGLFLGVSSSVTPGAPWENIATLVEGLNYYRTHGRG